MSLLKNNVATSPLERWPGTITFPEFLSLPDYKRWNKWLGQQVKVEVGDDSDTIMSNVANSFGFGVVAFEYVNGNPDEPEVETEVYTDRYLEPALMFGALKVKNLPNGALKDPLSSNMPYQLAIWISDVGKEWLERELSFPGYRDRIMVEPKGEAA